MDLTLSKDDQNAIKAIVAGSVQQALKQATDNAQAERPYLNRGGIAKFLGVSETTITSWAAAGMQVAVIDGYKLYGKAAVTGWIKSHEKALKKQNKKAC